MPEAQKRRGSMLAAHRLSARKNHKVCLSSSCSCIPEAICFQAWEFRGSWEKKSPLSWLRIVHCRHRVGELWPVLRTQGDREKTVLQINDQNVPSSGEHGGRGHTRLQHLHAQHSLFGGPVITSISPISLDNKTRGIPGTIGRLNVSLLQLFLH